MTAAAPLLIWIAFFATFYLCHRQVWAGARGDRQEKRVQRDRSSDYGMALQFAAVAIALLWPGPSHDGAMMWTGLSLAVASMLWVRWALLHLGRQWRVQAVIAEDHQLITSGPYRLVRHPVYLAFFAMLAATLLMRGNAAFALALFAAGTEIRVRAEERLLSAAFGAEFASYVARTRWAYLPGLR